MREFARESIVSRVGVRVKRSQKCKQESTQKSKVWRVWMGVHEGVKGSQNYKQKFAWESRVLRVGAKVHTKVKGSWNCKQESMRESRLLGVGVKIHIEVHGPRHGGESLKVSKVGVKVHGVSKGRGIASESPRESPWSWEWGQEIAQGSKGPTIISRNLCKSWRVLELQVGVRMVAQGPKNGGENPHRGWYDNLGYELLLQLVICVMSTPASTPLRMFILTNIQCVNLNQEIKTLSIINSRSFDLHAHKKKTNKSLKKYYWDLIHIELLKKTHSILGKILL
jgi:hypothetical protein